MALKGTVQNGGSCSGTAPLALQLSVIKVAGPGGQDLVSLVPLGPLHLLNARHVVDIS